MSLNERRNSPPLIFKENYSLWHHTGGKSLDFTPGMILQPLLSYQLRFYSCAGEPALPLVHGDRLPTDGGIHGEASPLACLWPLPGDQGFKAPRRGCAGGRLRPYIHPRKIRRRRADSGRGGARKRPAPVAVVRGHPEGKRRREPTRSKGPGICREAGPGVNGREADVPPPSRSVLPAVPATQTVKPAACQDPLCP